MDYKLYIKGKPDDMELLKCYVALINKLHIQGEGIENEDGIMWILRNVDDKDLPLIKKISKKTPSLQYHLRRIREKK